jgi:transglutaminase-like putative cysteine protease
MWRDGPLVPAVLLLALIAAGSTARAGWVSGTDALPGLTFWAAVVGCVVALSRWNRGPALILAPAPLAAYAATNPGPSPSLPVLVAHLNGLIGEVASGRAATDPSLQIFGLATLFWMMGAWLAWGTLRRRQPLLAVGPAGAAVATNVLNFPDGQDGFVFGFVVMTLWLMLWSTYQRSLAGAREGHLQLAGGAHWDFWERGAVATALVVVIGTLAPPLSTSDRTIDFENGLWGAWGQVTHTANGGSSSIGFTDDVPLGGSLARGGGVVFTYSVRGDDAGPRYFRGLNLAPGPGEWSFSRGPAVMSEAVTGASFSYAETYVEQQRAEYDVDIKRPPRSWEQLLLYPGQLVSVNRAGTASQMHQPDFGTRSGDLETVDRVILSGSSRGAYHVQVDESVATVEELRSAGTDYPGWAYSYRGLPGDYRSAHLEQRIHDLARQVTAGATNPYDQAAAIETYLRSSLFTYTLSPARPPRGVDPLEYFLFNSRNGYCQYFATAMADMLRSLGVPTRLVNGYGPGHFDTSQQRYVVQESDAHTWPEVYFPSYGWVPFEPTRDGTYLPIPRGNSAAAVGAGSDATRADASPAATPQPEPSARASAPAARGAGFTLPSLRSWTSVAALLLLIIALLGLALARYLRPGTASVVWRRAHLLVGLAGVPPRPGETPIELGDRVAGAFPEAATSIRRLASDFAVVAYAPAALAELSEPDVLADWEAVRPILLRQVASRLMRR